MQVLNNCNEIHNAELLAVPPTAEFKKAIAKIRPRLNG